MSITTRHDRKIAIMSKDYDSGRCRRFESLRNNLKRIVSPSGSCSRNRASSKLVTTEPTTGREKKRAVLCGVTYRKRKHRLKGTVNDVRHMKQLLVTKFGFREENIRVLTEEETDKQKIPTKKNIEEALRWLVLGCEPGDSLVFFFSGHGVRQAESEVGDEVDGYDETICPVDFENQGMILDNDINSTVVRPLPAGVTLHAIVDSCHSGTILDLPYVYDYRLGKWVDNSPPSGTFKGTKGGLAISLSACSDEEVASDTSLLSGRSMTGAMTYSLVQAIMKQGQLTYGDLLKSIHDAIKEANSKSRCLRLPRSKLLQEPMLSSSEMFDVNKKVIQL